jgi:hypothetical protein
MNVFWAFSAILVGFGVSTAQAADMYVGLEAGAAILNAGAGSRFNWVLDAGYKPLPNVIVGAYYDYIPFGSVGSPDGTSVSGSEKFYGVEGRYDFTPLLSGFSAGARFGLSAVSTQAFTVAGGQDNQSGTGFAWGPIFVYERPISQSFTLGGEAFVMLPSESGANNVIGLLATVKFWF